MKLPYEANHHGLFQLNENTDMNFFLLPGVLCFYHMKMRQEYHSQFGKLLKLFHYESKLDCFDTHLTGRRSLSCYHSSRTQCDDQIEEEDN